MRPLALAFLLMVLASTAQAETNQERVRRWFARPEPAPVTVPIPPAKPAEVKKPATQQPAQAPERPARLNPAEPKAPAKAKPKTKAPAKPKAPAPQPTVNINDPDYISCADARRGVTMSCVELWGGAHVYNAYSKKKKANAQACLTAAERARIKSCFQS